MAAATQLSGQRRAGELKRTVCMRDLSGSLSEIGHILSGGSGLSVCFCAYTRAIVAVDACMHPPTMCNLLFEHM